MSKHCTKSFVVCLLALGLVGTVATADEAVSAPAIEPTLAVAPETGPDITLESSPRSVSADCATQAPSSGVLFASSGTKGGGGQQLVTCTADCGPFDDVTCQASGTCVAVDRDCPGERGYVTCDGNTTNCPVCGTPSECDDGDFKFETGGCCDCTFGGVERFFYECINGQWVLQNSGCGPGGGCPICP